MKRPRTDHRIHDVIVHDLPLHQVLLSFLDDDGAHAFHEYWATGGRGAFEAWVATTGPEEYLT